MLATLKGGGESRARVNLRTRLVLERLTGQSAEDPYTNGDMERGRELEADARALYEAETGTILSTPGFYSADDLLVGCSPDGVTLDGLGLVDFKCPRPANHLEFLRSSSIPTEYARQLLHNLWVTGAEWAEIVSYCPQFPESMRLRARMLRPTADDLISYEAAATIFLRECDLELKALQFMANPSVVLAEVAR